MYTQKEINKVLRIYDKLRSQRETVRVLGYPSRNLLRQWLRERDKTGQAIAKHRGDLELKKKAAKTYIEHRRDLSAVIDLLGHPVTRRTVQYWVQQFYPKARKLVSGQLKLQAKRYSWETKVRAVLAMRRSDRTVMSVAREFSVSRQTLYAWDKEIPKPQIDVPEPAMSPIRKPPKATAVSPENEEQRFERACKRVEFLEKQVTRLALESEELQKQIRHLQLQKDVLVEVAKILKKGEDGNPTTFSNREKTIVIDVLRKTFKLKDLLEALRLSKSSYFYQRTALSQPDKSAPVKEQIRETFNRNYRCYGYRRIWYSLRRDGFRLSEKVVRRIMRQEGLYVYYPRKRKFCSYCGEVSPSVPSLLKRNFRATSPNQKWLTDITEFSLPAGKIYLSPIIDCYDGMPVSWTIGTSPTAELANTMLRQAVATLKPGDKPIIHSDRGGHYRWSEWIEITKKASLTRSMSKKGCSPDNSACEGFFGRIKNEMFHERDWRDVSLRKFMQILDDYLHWYASERIKITLGGLSPEDFRRRHLSCRLAEMR